MLNLLDYISKEDNEKIKALMFVNKRYEQVDIKITFTIKGMMI